MDFPVDDLDIVNDYLINDNASEIPQETVDNINKSLERGGIRLVDNMGPSFYSGNTELEFDGKPYGEYIKESVKEIEEGKVSSDDKYDEMAKEIINKLNLPENTSELLKEKLRNTIQAPVELKEIDASPEVRKGAADNVNAATDPSNNSSTSGASVETAKSLVENAPAEVKAFVEKPTTDAELKSKMDKIDKALKDLSDKAKNPVDKSWYDSAKEKFADALKLGLIGLAGFFTYEALAAHAAARTGCFVAKTDQKTGEITICKLSNLTCDMKAAAAGDLCSFNADKGWCKSQPKKGSPLYPIGCHPCQDDKYGIVDACNSCSGGADSPCSKYCNSAYLITSMNGYNYDYKCVSCDMQCAFYDMWNKVTDIISKAADTVGSIWEFLTNIFKYGIYFIIGFIVLYCAYWLITKFTGGKDDKNKESGTTFVLNSPPPAPQLSSSSSSTNNLRVKIPSDNNGIDTKLASYTPTLIPYPSLGQ